jgi:Lamin Tail Domain
MTGPTIGDHAMSRARLAAALLALPVAACGGGGGNTPDCQANLLPGDLVITEIFADYAAPAGSSGADTGNEWFEIYNASTAPIDLKGVVLTLSRPDGTSVKTHAMAEATIAPGAYFVLGDVDPGQVPAWVDYGYGSDLGEMFNTNGGKLALSCNDVEVDHALYDTVESGFSQQFDGSEAPDYTSNDDLAKWCPADAANSPEFTPSNYGTPGAANQDCVTTQAGMCNDNGTQRAVVPPGPGDLVIDEVMASPSGTDSEQEWFEVYVARSVDLNGVGLDRAGDSSSPDVLTSPDCMTVATGDYLVFAKSTDSGLNGMLPRVDGTFKFSLVGTGDIQVLDPDGNLVDAVTWTSAATGASRQLDPDFSDATANDMERYWCDATIPWVAGPPPGDDGSPGAVNEQCAILPPAGMCHDTGTNADRNIVPPTAGQLVITEVFPNQTGNDDQKKDWFEARAAADVDLNDSQIGRSGGTQTKIASADCIHLDVGDYALFAGSTVSGTNGGLPTVTASFPFNLVQGSSGSPGDVQILDPQGTLVDAVTWTGSTDGAARQLSSDIIAAIDAATQNDDPASPIWCDATTAYNGTDLGTPGADNDVQCQ